jgi:putative tryptophan/tyrosine transport system substrate-binding protein
MVWPLAGRAQQADRVRRIGVLMSRAASDPEGQARYAAFEKGLQKLGWSEGRDIRIDIRWSPDVVARRAKPAATRPAIPTATVTKRVHLTLW